jgi:ElaB/YqjD/DUF883 family membrane-anchored ribosome-binding protein
MADVSMAGLNAYANHSNFLDNHLAQKAAQNAPNTQSTAAQTGAEVKTAENSASDAVAKVQEESTSQDTVVIKESTAPAANNAKNANNDRGISDILADMQESVSKLGSDSGDSEKSALESLQAELQSFISGYNDALNYAKSYGTESLMKSASSMVSRTDTYGSALQGIGIGINTDNSLSQLGNLQSQTAGERKAIQSLFGGNYSYGAKTRDTVAEMVKTLSQGTTYSAGTYDPMNVSGAE